MSKNKVESVVIVKGAIGSTATLRFSDPQYDIILSSFDNSQASKNFLYNKISKHIKEATNE